MEPEPAPEQARKPQMKIIVRLLIYLPLLGYFGYQAARGFIDQRVIADDNFRAELQQWLEHPATKTIIMPNGEAMPVLELTEDEAVQMGLMPEPAKAETETTKDP